MKTRLIGLIILIAVIAGSLAYKFISDGDGKGFNRERITVKGYIGSEKSNFLDNPEVQTILRNKYGIIIDYQKAGSIEMVNTIEIGDDIDFLWPSSQVASELYKMNTNGNFKTEIVFNSPIVLYSWDLVTEALVEQKIVREVNSTYYIVDIEKLINLASAQKSWKEIGLDQLYGNVTIISTDPTKSNSGNMFSGLLANILSGGVVTENSIDNLLPEVEGFFSRMGYMEHSTGILFEQFLSKGVGSYPLIVGYENQIVEFSLQNPDVWPRVRQKLRILYPEPTVWSSHPIIALTDDGKKLLEALQDEELQKLAWEQHGFRSGLMGVSNDPSILEIAGIPEDITKVIPMPTPQVMLKIIDALSQ